MFLFNNKFNFIDFNNNNFISNENNSDNNNFQNREIDDIEEEELQKPKKKPGFFGKIGNFLEKTKNNLETKIKDMKIGEKAKDLAKTTKTFVSEKSKDLIV